MESISSKSLHIFFVGFVLWLMWASFDDQRVRLQRVLDLEQEISRLEGPEELKKTLARHHSMFRKDLKPFEPDFTLTLILIASLMYWGYREFEDWQDRQLVRKKKKLEFHKLLEKKS